jgi:uncharacterized protein
MIGVFNDVLNYSLLLGAGIAFVSAMIQGYSGFGGGLVIVPVLAILFGPIEAISITAIAALSGNFMLWPDAAKKANWREAGPLGVAIAISTMLGLLFLTTANPDIIRRGMGVFVLAAALLLISGYTYQGKRTVFSSVFAGALTGGVTGGFGIPGGPFMVIYYMSASDEPPIQRANIIVSVAIAIVFLLGGLIMDGAYTQETIARSVVIVPIFMSGAWCGRYLFKIAPLAWFKKVVYAILLITGASILFI